MKLRITHVETFVVGTKWRNLLFLQVHTDQGLVGVGEATLEWKERAVEALIQEFDKRYLRGADPFQIESLWLRMYRDEFWRGGPVVTTAISGIEIALWDLKGKALGVPVYQLLGGPVRERVWAYANGWYVGERTPEAFAAGARGVVERGYTALKFDPFGSADREVPRQEKLRSIAIVEAVRDAVGPDVEVLIECHGRFSPATAIEFARELERFRPFWYEEPLPPENVDALARVASQVRIPIATGERIYTKYQWWEVLRRGCVDIIQPDILHCGGILEAKKIAAMADACYLAAAPHNPVGPIGTAVAVQLAACTSNHLIQESFDDFDMPWRKELVRGALSVEGGTFLVPDRPGIGVELNLEAIREHPPVEGAFLPMWETEWEKRFF